jgi:putative proteasome-type protease
MTYCVGFCLEDGLVLASDSRTNAGVDYVTSYSKMHVFTPAPDRLFLLLAAGNLATTQEIVNRIRRDIDYPSNDSNLLSARYLFEAADYIGRLNQAVQQQHQAALQASGVSGETTLLLGGQIQGDKHSLLLIYPQGNYIEASINTPYLQIGETKYGKPVLDRVVDYRMSVADAARLALVSLSSTAKSNITVGPPFELCVYRNGAFQIDIRCRFEEKRGYLSDLEDAWNKGLQLAFDNLPPFEWETAVSGFEPAVQAQAQRPPLSDMQQPPSSIIQQDDALRHPPTLGCGPDDQLQG